MKSEKFNTSIRIDLSLAEELDKIAKSFNRSRNWIVEAALRMWKEKFFDDAYEIDLKTGELRRVV